MNRENLKCILSLICIIGGVLFSSFSYITLNPTTPSYTASFILSFGLCIVGVISFFVHYHNHNIITKLKGGKIPLLAHWTYHPKDFEQVRYQLEDDRYITLSIIFLLGICGLFICLGTFFTSIESNISLGLLCAFLLIVIISFSLFAVFKYYHQKLSSPHDALISEDYIYFKSELYSLQKSVYFLEHVDVIYINQYYIQFTYGAPGTPYGPFHIISIPIPKDQLEAAYTIQRHFLNRLKENRIPPN